MFRATTVNEDEVRKKVIDEAEATEDVDLEDDDDDDDDDDEDDEDVTEENA